MLELTAVLVITSLLCLGFDSTRWVGVAGIALLVSLHPLLFLALLGFGCVIFCCYHHHKRRTIREIRTLDSDRFDSLP